MANDVPAGHVVIELDGFIELVDKLKDSKSKVENCEKLTAIIANELLNASDRAFENERDPSTGTSWEEWCPEYLKSLVMKGKQDHKKLMMSGDLYDRREAFYDETSGGVGSNLVYARIHQLGGGDSNPDYPARPFLGIDDYAERKINKHVLNYCRKLLN